MTTPKTRRKPQEQPHDISAGQEGVSMTAFEQILLGGCVCWIIADIVMRLIVRFT